MYPGRRRWPHSKSYHWVEACPLLTPGAKRLYCRIAAAAGNTSVSRHWSNQRLADALACDERSITRWFGELMAHGFLERQPAQGLEGGHRYYFLHHPAMPITRAEQDAAVQAEYEAGMMRVYGINVRAQNRAGVEA